MEAPEKIYLIRNFPTSTSLNTTNDNHLKFRQEWYKSREKSADVEYTRTAAFIDKACNAYCRFCGHDAIKSENYTCRQDCGYYRAFRKMMEE